jgi:hypothetical protein
MEHLAIRVAPEEQDTATAWAKSTLDGELLDLDIFAHQSTFLLSARSSGSGRVAYLPVQQPLMLENLIFRPGLSDRDRALAITRLTESAIGEAYRRDVGELYFLCREPSTCAFAERHKFTLLPPELKVYRLNLLETFGA